MSSRIEKLHSILSASFRAHRIRTETHDDLYYFLKGLDIFLRSSALLAGINDGDDAEHRITELGKTAAKTEGRFCAYKKATRSE